MGKRHIDRELTLQFFFSIEVNRVPVENAIEDFTLHFAEGQEVSPFFMRLVQGVTKSLSEIDVVIEKFSKNWKMERISIVDKNILRIAIYEILYCDDIPPAISIDEAIDIAKDFSTNESRLFINAILDNVKKLTENKTPNENDIIELGGIFDY